MQVQTVDVAGYLGAVRQSDSIRYLGLGLCVYGLVGFGLHHTPPVFSILFTTLCKTKTPSQCLAISWDYHDRREGEALSYVKMM